MAYLRLAVDILVFYVVPVMNLALLVVLVRAVRRIGRTQRVDDLALSLEIAAVRAEHGLDEATAAELATALRLANAWEAGELSRAECLRVARAMRRAASLPPVDTAPDDSPLQALRRFARHWAGA
jgi:hypothetical protein